MPVSILAPQACHAFSETRATSESQAAWPKLVRDLKADFQLFGLDIVQPLCLGWYDQLVCSMSHVVKLTRSLAEQVCSLQTLERLVVLQVQRCHSGKSRRADTQPQPLRCVAGLGAREFWSCDPLLQATLFCRAKRDMTVAGDRTLALIIGNSKNIWLPFLEACKYDPDLLAKPNPLDVYVERTVAAAVQVSAQGCVSLH